MDAEPGRIMSETGADIAHQSASAAVTGRFAPSTSGRAHPGTLLAALLAWLDARSRGGGFVLRLDDADPQRCRAMWSTAMRADLRWLGLDWDQEQSQRARRAAHIAQLDALAERGLLYACTCSRSALRTRCAQAADGSLIYDGRCREQQVAAGAWQGQACRLRLPEALITLHDASGADLSDRPLAHFGDPIVWRRDGSIAYQLAVVLDDAAAGVTDVVRGRDLAHHSAMQAQLHDLLDMPRPVYRHHLLLMERQGTKLAKYHRAVDCAQLQPHYQPAQLCGLLAQAAGLQDAATACRPSDLLADFDWRQVCTDNRLVTWDGQRLYLEADQP